jgi:serine/threonine-protein kinase
MSDVALPATIGRYEVERVLGQGGMGRVFLARDSVLGRRVALKVLRDDLGLPPEHRQELFRRMRNEARAAAALSHPYMVTLHDMGEDAELGLYLVFEYVDGSTLRERVASGPLPLSEIPKLARALGGALAHAHEAGVIHRDVKPENVLLSKTGPKLGDFGIARIPDSTLTGSGSVLGTPAYSAPEALAQGEFSAKSDQFSLAATLYEAICGERAFPGSDALVVAGRIASEQPPPLEAVDSDPRVVTRLNAVLRRGMAKDKADRYASCNELGEAVAAAIEAPLPEISQITPALVPSESMPASVRPSVILRKKTHRVQNIVAAAGLLTIVTLVAIGRRNRDDGDGVSLRSVASAFGSASMRHSAPTASQAPAPKPQTSASASVPRADSRPPKPDSTPDAGPE